MSIFKHFLEKLFSPLDAQQQAEQDYLAKSVDACDLERRMHDLEYHDASMSQGKGWADFARAQSVRRPW